MEPRNSIVGAKCAANRQGSLACWVGGYCQGAVTRVWRGHTAPVQVAENPLHVASLRQ